jgi:hypothetical protein
MIVNRIIIPVIFFSVIFILSSCEIINPPEEIPSYLQVDTIKLLTNPATEGKNTHSITDVWAYVDGTLIGAFELPAKFPVLATGKHHIILYPGIKKNGIAASRIIYPFYTSFEGDTTLTEKQVLKINPTITYRNEAIFAWIEDFESAGTTIDTTSKSDVPVNIFSEPNNQTAYIMLDSAHTMFECASTESFDLPGNDDPVYLEMDYMNSHIFVMGLFINKISIIVQQPVIYLNPTTTWKKICIDLSYYTTVNTDAINYNIFFGMYKSDTLSVATIYLDNLKLIHF